jgi:hypothetical protein
MESSTSDPMTGPALDLYWIPLGAGAQVVRFSGKVYESVVARAHHREPSDLYHSALIASVAEGRYFMEMTPIPRDVRDRGVVGEGAVGTSLLGRFRVFRYELRRWLDGTIPDLAYAVASPVRLTTEEAAIRRVLDLMPLVPTPVWGRDEFRAGEMWNSNSVISWVLSRANLLAPAGSPPNAGRAPGWNAGLAVAARDKVATSK